MQFLQNKWRKTSYIITTNGEVYKTKNNKFKKNKSVKLRNGYFLVHMHKDGHKDHNNVDNLEWATQKENVRHAFNMNLRHFGEKSSNAKITNKQAKMICEMIEDNKLTMHEISDIIGCSYNTVFGIKTGKSWTDLSKNYNFDSYNLYSKNRGKHKLSESDIKEICDLIQSKKYTMRHIANTYGVYENTIYRIKAKTCWKDITCMYDFE